MAEHVDAVAEQEAAAMAAVETRPESPWRREEVVQLVRAWREVVTDPTLVSGGHQHAQPVSLKTRIFETFQALLAGNTTRTMNSLVKTRKSLLRSFRFIAVFNQNHIIARSMSAAFSGQNWFAIPTGEQRRIVETHYKRKPFAYIDEEIFSEIEMILDAEQRSTEQAPVIKMEPSSFPDAEIPNVVGESDDVEERSRMATPKSMGFASSNPQKASTAWRREDVLLLLRAWMEILDGPPIQDESAAAFDLRVFARFQELSGGETARSPVAAKIKRLSLIKSFKFISDFNQNKVIPPTGATPSSAAIPSSTNWHALHKKTRKSIIQEHYKKSHFTHIDEDMLPTIATIMLKSRMVAPRTLSIAQAASSIPVVNEEPWTRREDTLLLRAWRDVVDGLGKKFTRDESVGAVDSRIYQRFVVLSEGETSREESDVTARQATLVNTFVLISGFNLANGSLGDGVGPQQSWFSLRKGERKVKIVKAERRCADIDEAMYTALEKIFLKEKQTVNTDVVPPPIYTKAATMWHRSEVFQLLRAWQEIVRQGPLAANEPLYAFNSRIYENFVALSDGKTMRTEKAVIAKRESIINSFQFISDYNENSVLPRGVLSTGTETNDWFSNSHDEQRYIVKAHYKKVSFSYLYSDMLPIVQEIVEKSKSMETQDVAPAVAAGSRKGRPSSWSREELLHLARAWREIRSENPPQSDESDVSLNARIYAKFLLLCNGNTKKSEDSVRSKRRTLTSTYEFISDFNRRKRADGLSPEWFSLSEVDRRSKIVSANKVAHACTDIDENVFKALETILGRTDSSTMDGSVASTSRLVAPGKEEDPKSDQLVNSRRDTLDRDVLGERCVLGSVDTGVDLPRKRSESSPAKRKSALMVHQKVRGEETAPVGLDSSGPYTGGTRSTRSETSRLAHTVSSARNASKKRRLVPDLGALTSSFESQANQLHSLLFQVIEERKLQEEERRQMLALIELDQEERRKDREDRKLEREQMGKEWIRFHEERRYEGEQDRALLKELLDRL